METYNAKLISADFEESTMEFEIQHEFTVKAGDYVILHKADYEKLVSGAESEDGKLPIPHVSNSALQNNNKLVENMCISYRHDFGLMKEEEKNDLRFQCKEWLKAYENNREHCC